MAACFQVLVLGPFQVLRDGEPLDVSSWPRRSQRLLKLLVTAPETRRLRDELIDVLWPETDSDAGGSSLRGAVYQLRRGLGDLDPSPVLARRGYVLLNSAYRWDVDYERFGQLLGGGGDDVATIESALHLVRGDVLDEERYDDWAVPLREAVDQRWRDGCLRLVTVLERQGRSDDALSWALRLAQRDPLDEGAIQTVLRLLGTLGRRSHGVQVYERFVRTLRQELDVEPSPETEALVDWLKQPPVPEPTRIGVPPANREEHTDESRAVPPPGGGPAEYSHSLPSQPTPFLGRHQELSTVSELIRKLEVRLLTITGSGGAGKTRLAIQAVSALRDTFPHGVFFVNLASVTDPGLIASVVAGSLNIHEARDQPLLTTLKEYLANRQVLLLIDNFEHLLDGATLIGDLLGSCPALKVLVTSRAILHLAAEHVFRVPPLSLPDLGRPLDPESLSQYDAVALFIARARAVRADFMLTEANGRLVGEICCRLDGLPLAIELAAARTRHLTLQDVRAGLLSGLRLLTGGARDTPTRQQTLRQTIDWSYRLLTESEQQLFAQTSVFAGGFTLDAAQSVCDPQDHSTHDLMDGVASLVDQSLLRQIEQSAETSRFVLLETIREYAAEQLEHMGPEMTQKRFAAYYLSVAEQAARELKGSRQAEWLNRLEGELPNFRAVLKWAVEREDSEIAFRLGAALWRFWDVRGHLSEGQRWFKQILACNGAVAAPLRARTLNGAGNLALSLGDFEHAVSLFREALAKYREIGNTSGVAAVLGNLGLGLLYRGEYQEAEALETESLALRRELGGKATIAGALGNLGLVALCRGDHDRAATLFGETLEVGRELGDTTTIAISLNNLGVAALARGDLALATQLQHEALALFGELGEKEGVVACIEALACVAAAEQKSSQAGYLWGAAEALRESLGASMTPPDRELHLRYVAIARENLGEKAFDEAWASGKILSLDEALDYLYGQHVPA